MSAMDYDYFALITVTTVGYGDIVPQTMVGRMLIMVLKNFRAKVARSSGGTATSKTQSSLHHVRLLASWFSVKKVHALLQSGAGAIPAGSDTQE